MPLNEVTMRILALPVLVCFALCPHSGSSQTTPGLQPGQNQLTTKTPHEKKAKASAYSAPSAKPMATPHGAGTESAGEPASGASMVGIVSVSPALIAQTTPGTPGLVPQPPSGPYVCQPEATGYDLESQLWAHRECEDQICNLEGAVQQDQADQCIQTLQTECLEGNKVLLYDARFGNLTSWTGLRTRKGGSPFAYSRDQVVVEVCDIKFDPAVSISLVVEQPPEKGFDIRGATVTTTTPSVSIGATTDTLQAATTSLNAALAATLPSTSTPQVLAANTIITPSSLAAGQYTPIKIGATPDDFAQMVHAYREEARSTLAGIRFLCSGRNITCPASTPVGQTALSGIVEDLAALANDLNSKISRDSSADSHLPVVPGPPPPAGVAPSPAQREASNQGTFDNATAEAQQFAVKLSALDSAITLPSFSTRIATLATNYRSLSADVKTLEQIAEYDAMLQGTVLSDAQVDGTAQLDIDKRCSSILKTPLSAQGGSAGSQVTAGGAPASVTITTSIPGQQPVTTTVAIPGAKAAAKPAAQPAAQPADQGPTAQEAEYCMVRQFLKDFYLALPAQDREVLHANSPPDDCLDGHACSPQILYAELRNLRKQLFAIDSSTASAFQAMNQWYERSSMAYIDLLTPSTTNAAYRLGITASPTYVPFTLSASTGAGASSSSTSPVPPPASGHIAQSTSLFIHRRANFNLMGGAVIVNVETKAYALTPSTVILPSSTTTGTLFSPCGAASSAPATNGNVNSYYCPTVTQTSPLQIAAMVALNWFPWGRDYYPNQPVRSKWITFRDMFGGMLGTSVTNLGTGFGGINFEPSYGLSFYAGVASANSQRLPTGVTLNTPYPSSTSLQTVTTLHAGIAFGVGFDLGVASSIFRFSTPAAF